MEPRGPRRPDRKSLQARAIDIASAAWMTENSPTRFREPDKAAQGPSGVGKDDEQRRGRNNVEAFTSLREPPEVRLLEAGRGAALR